jgi:UDP-glucose 4-epimerase
LGMSRNPMENGSDLAWIMGDLSNPLEMFEQIKAYQPEAVFHLAWEGIPDFSEKQCRKNVVQSLNFLGLIGEISSVKKIIVSGSCWEYGKRSGACSEIDDTVPGDWFTWSKFTVQDYLCRVCENLGIDWYWGRIFFVYGPKQRDSSLIPSTIVAMQNGDLPDVRSPWAKNDFVYVEDVVAGLASCLAEECPSGIYNFGSGNEVTVLEVVRTLDLLLHGDTKITQQIEREIKLPRQMPLSFFANPNLSNTVLDWKTEMSLREGLQRTLNGNT